MRHTPNMLRQCSPEERTLLAMHAQDSASYFTTRAREYATRARSDDPNRWVWRMLAKSARNQAGEARDNAALIQAIEEEGLQW